MNKKGIFNIVLWVVVLAALIGIALFVNSQRDPNVTPDRNISDSGTDNGGNNNSDKNLSPAYDFELKDLNGNTVRLSDYKGKIVFLNFWASWCPPCIGEMPEFDKASKEFDEKGDALILAVNLTNGYRGETEERARQFINEKGYSLRVLFDKTGSVADRYNIVNIPTTYVINKDGNIETYFVGQITENTLMDMYNKLK